MGKIQIISAREAFDVQIGESVFTIRRLHRDVIANSRRRHTRIVPAEEPGAQPRTEVDEQAVNDDLVDYVIQAWTGVTGPGDEDVPCTLENKLALPTSALGDLLVRARALNTRGDLDLAVKNLQPPSGQAGPGSGRTPPA